jgi:hypothetical protein
MSMLRPSMAKRRIFFSLLLEYAQARMSLAFAATSSIAAETMQLKAYSNDLDI